ncbi:unnamed protein product [Paramecium primaurelia]|uniref:Uncharacterized protein n=1 Tax=Paramecium primaurelia TaxID=5886 RepID=A0A8S1LK20_PARPR|nr:unnamed protein product [Paramecium primaurelia]
MENEWNLKNKELQNWKQNQKLNLDRKSKEKKRHEIINYAYRQIFINRYSNHNGMNLTQQS